MIISNSFLKNEARAKTALFVTHRLDEMKELVNRQIYMDFNITDKLFKTFFFLFMAIFISGCDTKIDLNPKKLIQIAICVNDVKMVLVIANFGAEPLIQRMEEDYCFDDIGCVILWFKETKSHGKIMLLFG